MSVKAGSYKQNGLIVATLEPQSACFQRYIILRENHIEQKGISMKIAITTDALPNLIRETEQLLTALRAVALDPQHDLLESLSLTEGANVQSGLDTLWHLIEDGDTDLHKAARRAEACFVLVKEVEGV